MSTSCSHSYSGSHQADHNNNNNDDHGVGALLRAAQDRVDQHVTMIEQPTSNRNVQIAIAGSACCFVCLFASRSQT